MPDLLFDQNLVYHSMLKRHSPLVVRFSEQGLMESKYNEGEQIIYFDIRGKADDGRYYLVENDQCARRIDNAPLGEWVRVSATGDKDTPGDLIIEEVSGGSGIEFEMPDGPDNYDQGTVLDNYLACIEAAKQVPGAVDEDGVLTEAGIEHAESIFIYFCKFDFKMPAHEGMVPDQEEAPDEPVRDIDPAVVEAGEELVKEIDWTGEAHDGRDLEEVHDQIVNVLETAEEEEDIHKVNRWMGKESKHQAETNIGGDDLPF